MNKIDFAFHQIVKNNNDEYYTPEYAITPLLKYLKPTVKTIWCPFDTEQSFFVKVFKKNGYEVIATHIKNGQDFFTTKVPKCDCIISNPPYSKKNEVLEKLFPLDIPFAMLLGVVGLFESQKRFDIFSKNEFEIMYFNKRVAFFKDFEEQTPSVNTPFSSVYICHRILPQKIIFEKVDKTMKGETE